MPVPCSFFSSHVLFAWLAISAIAFTSPVHVHATVIVNGDFELGNSSFFSDYIYTPGVQPFPGLGGGQYNIVVNPSPFHFAAGSYGDHTSGSGKMLMVNADWNLPNIVVWSQSVAVEKNTTYEFSTWISTWAIAGDLNVSRIDVRINGLSIGKQTAPSDRGAWEKFSALWNSETSVSANIQIYEVGREIGFPGGGNDFSLDDINFHTTSSTVPEPSSLVISYLSLVYLVCAKRLSQPRKR